MKCRCCGNDLKHTFIDLGYAPPSNAYLKKEDLSRPEITLPLRVKVCEKCWLVQTEDFVAHDILFDADYAYFSSASSSWLTHAKKYVKQVTEELKLNEKSFVVEIASNDGYLLKNFVDAKIPCLGIEPTNSTADAAEKIGIPIVRKFFGDQTTKDLLKRYPKADLICGNNVYAHVPDINDFTKGLKALLAEGGTITLEFPHLLKLIQYNQFDTIYHEHFSYLSLTAVKNIFENHGLEIYKVEELTTHGGSLRIYGHHTPNYHPGHAKSAAQQLESVRHGVVHPSVNNILSQEKEYGLTNLDTYLNFQSKAVKVKNDFLAFLIEQKRLGKKVIGYGAAAKGNTLLNYAGVKSDLLPAVCDISPSKQGKYLPGSHIPIISLKQFRTEQPDFIVIFPWNIKDEVIQQEKEHHASHCKFIINNTFIL